MPTLSADRLVRPAVFGLTALLLAMLWGFAGFGKLLSGGVPAWFTEQFSKTFLTTFPGLAPSYYALAILESLAAVLAIASILRAEPFRTGSPIILYIALITSLLLFVQLAFGKLLLSDFDGVHDLFMYFAGTIIILGVVRTLDIARTVAPR